MKQQKGKNQSARGLGVQPDNTGEPMRDRSRRQGRQLWGCVQDGQEERNRQLGGCDRGSDRG